MDYEELYKQEIAKNATLTDDLAKLQERVTDGSIVSDAVKAGDVYEAKRFTGLSKTLNEKSEELTNLLDKLGTKEEELRTAGDSLSDVTGKHETVISERDELSQSLTTSDRRIERLDLIIKEFPNLASLEGEGLLPQADDMDGLRTKFSALSEKMETLVDDGITEKLKGAKEKKPSQKNKHTSSQTKDSILKHEESMAAHKKGDYPEYRRLRNEAIDLEVKEGAAK